MLRQLLDAYAENLSTAEGIRRVFGMSQEKFEQGYVAYLKKLAAELSATANRPSAELDELLRASGPTRKMPNSAAELAYAYLRREAFKEARELATKAVGLRADQPLAITSSPGWRSAQGKVKEAEAMLVRCVGAERARPAAAGTAGLAEAQGRGLRGGGAAL